MAGTLLRIEGLKTHFATDEGMVHAVDGVDLGIDRGETLGVVGESGCGKSVTALSVLKLIAMPPGRIVAGEILWRGRDLMPLEAKAMQGIRSKEIAMVFQEPMTSLNPVYTVGDQVAEVIRLHEGLGRRRGAGQGGRDAAAGAHPAPGAPRARLSQAIYVHPMDDGEVSINKIAVEQTVLPAMKSALLSIRKSFGDDVSADVAAPIMIEAALRELVPICDWKYDEDDYEFKSNGSRVESSIGKDVIYGLFQIADQIIEDFDLPQESHANAL